MPLSGRERRELEHDLDVCDAAIANKPSLASAYDGVWRHDNRRSLLKLNRRLDATYPRAYALPILPFYPSDLQDRIEWGAKALLDKLRPRERNHLIERFRNDSLAAEEEALLAGGFAGEFGVGAVAAPVPGNGGRIAEFTVRVGSQPVDIEAKGLLDSRRVRQLNDAAIRSGEPGWAVFYDATQDCDRLRASIVKKVLHASNARPTIIVLTQYTAWPSVDEALDLLGPIALRPNDFNLPPQNHPLGLAYVTEHVVQGVWLNPAVATQCALSDELCNDIRDAIRCVFYLRSDGLFVTE